MQMDSQYRSKQRIVGTVGSPGSGADSMVTLHFDGDDGNG